MRRLLVVMVFGLFIFAPIVFAPVPQTVSITFTIKAANVQDFLAGFLEMNPIPVVNEPNEMNPAYTSKSWVKEWGRREYFKAYKAGKERLAAKATQANKAVIE